MELQLAVDFTSLEEAMAAIRDLEPYLDILEIGTPLILSEGVRAVVEIKAAFPGVRLLADLKIMDAGGLEARIGLDAGADIVTVLGAAADQTIRAAATEAHRVGKAVMVDMIGVGAIEERTGEVDAIGVDYLCVHTAFDQQHTGGNPLEELRRIKSLSLRSRIAVAGGIRLETIEEIVASSPDLVIVGSGVLGQHDRVKVAKEIARCIHGSRGAGK